MWWPIVTVMLGVSDRSVIGVLLSSRSPAASINALRVKCGGPSQGRASGERSERSLDAAEHFHRIHSSKRRHVDVTGSMEVASISPASRKLKYRCSSPTMR